MTVPSMSWVTAMRGLLLEEDVLAVNMPHILFMAQGLACKSWPSSIPHCGDILYEYQIAHSAYEAALGTLSACV